MQSDARRSATMAVVIFLLMALFLAVDLRVETLQWRINVDENIVWAVGRSMIERGDFNANWKIAPDILSYFKDDMHNFYSYNLIALPFVTDDELETISRLRSVNIGLQLAAFALIWAALSNAKVPYARRVLAITALAVLPTMVLDAHLARAESFLYLLASLLIFVASLQTRSSWRWVAIGVLIGFGCASKVTFAACLLIVAPEYMRLARENLKRSAVIGAVLTISAFIGFAIGSPYSIIEPRVFVTGLQHLAKQYGGEHLPHSDPGSTVFDRAIHVGWFAIGITGFGVFTAFFIGRKAPDWVKGTLIMSVLTIAYFSTKSVFFERNISLALFGMVIVGAAFCKWRPAYLIFPASLAIMGCWSYEISRLTGTPSYEDLRTFEKAEFGAIVPHAWPKENPAEFLSTCNDPVIGILDFGDKTSGTIISSLGQEPIAVWRGAFSALPTSSLNTYLETTHRYYRCTGSGQRN